MLSAVRTVLETHRSRRRRLLLVRVARGGPPSAYTPQGDIDREIDLPVSKPTMCEFGGEDLETMYVTSASEGVNTADEPLAGALLRFRPGVKGIARSCTVRAARTGPYFDRR